jgi:hypothetical protein
MTPRRTDGVCACALAFSTLLSSQGADAHLQKTHIFLGGNPSNLPARSSPVNIAREALPTAGSDFTIRIPLGEWSTDDAPARWMTEWVPGDRPPCGVPHSPGAR